jgi:signal peptide peptidase SppA
MTPINSILTALAPLLTERGVLLGEQHARGLINKMADLVRNPPAAGPGDAGPADDGYARVGGKVAVIPLVGVLTKAPTWYDDIIGLCPTAAKMDDQAAAVADPEVAAIVFDIDSPGGFVNGTVELADAVAAANDVKPVVAVVRGMCCSGAYWIASQCGSIVARRESEVGNIGVYSVLADVSQFYASMGVVLETITSGQFKGLGADGRITDDLRAETTRIVNGLCGQFVAAVAVGRGMTLSAAATIADGRAYLGADAKQRGLVDSLATSFDAAVGTITTTQQGTTMSNATKTRKTFDNCPAWARGMKLPTTAKPVPAAKLKSADPRLKGYGPGLSKFIEGVRGTATA